MRAFRRYVGRRMIVQLGEQTLDGTLSAVERDAVMLTEAALLTNVADPLRIDGEVAIPSGRIDWVQVV